MSMFKLTHAYPDCPTCGSRVDDVKHESIDDERYLDTAFTVHSKGNPFILQPCGHEMYGCQIQDLGAADAKVTDWTAVDGARVLSSGGA